MSGIVLPNLGLNGDIADRAAWGPEYRANDRRLDTLVMLSVKDQLNTPPVSPLDGDRYLVGSSPTGDWLTEANNIAVFNAPEGVWQFYAPKIGWSLYLEDEDTRLSYGTQWYKGAAILNVKDFGVVGDGVVDDEPALNLLFDYVGALTSGPTTVYFPKGTYLIKAPVTVDGESLSSAVAGLRIIGDPGATIKTPVSGTGWVGSSNGALFQFRASATPATNIVIEDLIFDGSAFGTTSNSTMGIYAFAVTGLTIRNCTFQNLGNTALGISSAPRNDGIILGDDVTDSISARAKDVRIEQCRFVNVVRNGISMLDVDGVVVENCHFENIDNSGIDIEPNFVFQFARDILIRGCTFTDWQITSVVAIPGASLRGAIYSGQMEGLKIVECYMDGVTTGDSGVLVYNWIDVDISRNTILRVDDPAILVRSCHNVRVIGNHIRDNADVNGAILVNMADTIQPTDHVIQGNTLKTSAGHAIRVIDLNAGAISGNIIRIYDTALAARVGISLLTSTSTCKNITVIGNIVVGGGGAGGAAGGGKPIAVAAACTRIVVVGNVCQEIATGLLNTESIDNDATSTVQGFNADDQRVGRLFSGIGVTPMTNSILGHSSTARQSCMEVTVGAGAAAGVVSVVSDIVNIASAGNVVFSPINVAAAAMVGAAIGVFCTRTATGFDLTHNGNGAGTSAIFQCILISA